MSSRERERERESERETHTHTHACPQEGREIRENERSLPPPFPPAPPLPLLISPPAGKHSERHRQTQTQHSHTHTLRERDSKHARKRGSARESERLRAPACETEHACESGDGGWGGGFSPINSHFSSEKEPGKIELVSKNEVAIYRAYSSLPPHNKHRGAQKYRRA